MKRKFLRAVMMISTDKLLKNSRNRVAASTWLAATQLLTKPDAIDDQAQAHGEGRLKSK